MKAMKREADVFSKGLIVLGLVFLGLGAVGFQLNANPLIPVESGDHPVIEAPEFPGGLAWLQSQPLRMADLRGRVVVVHFWTNGCINCIHNYPVYKQWREKYAEKDLNIIGVHTPEFAHEANADKILAKARGNGLQFPIVVDNDKKVWQAWNNAVWPCIYLVDKKGLIRSRWEGELHLDNREGRQFAAQIDKLLRE
jgi:thiol-disulfide isomerase/thioredoxin